MLPDTVVFQTPKEPFDQPILFRSLRHHKFLLQPIIATGLSEASILKDQVVIIAKHRRAPNRAEPPKPCQPDGLYGSFEFHRPSSQGKLRPNNVPVMTIDARGEMAL